ncbi:MAG: hypothetical protein ACR2HB_03105 [Dehalococcoidia bacterium]
MRETIRTHVVIPKELLEAIDGVVGSRKRSDFVVDALQEELSRERRAKALRETTRVLDVTNYPEWETPEKISEWV